MNRITPVTRSNQRRHAATLEPARPAIAAPNASASIQVGRPTLTPMLAPKPKTKRLLEITQIVLTFASVCTVIDACRIDPKPSEHAGYYASRPQQSGVQRDRLLGDLARTERKRREAALRALVRQRVRGWGARITPGAPSSYRPDRIAVSIG